MVQENFIFNHEEMLEFRSWLKLNLEGLTWQGRFEKEFEEFWKTFFQDDLNFTQVMTRFEYACDFLKIGPLNSWFHWLQEKFLAYTFINKKISIYELSLQTQYSFSEVASILRIFFLEAYPYLDDEITEKFQLGNIASQNLLLTYERFVSDLDIKQISSDLSQDEIMSSLEVTLYEEWGLFLNKIKIDFGNKKFNFQDTKSKKSLKKILILIIEFIVLLGVIIGGVYLTKEANIWYEKYLVDQIKTFEPQMDWLDRTLTFRSIDKFGATEAIEVDFDEIEKTEVSQSEEILDILETEGRSGTESNLSLTSWDSLPKDFNTVDLEHSDYEELKTKGYRDSRYGSTKVYRILMRSSDSTETSRKLKDLLEKYEVTQVDNVRPGTEVPGGVYYNLFVPRDLLKEFLARVMEVDDSTLYESRTRSGRNPKGKNKVFIWIKSF